MKTHGIKFRQRKKTLASILAEFSRQSLKQKIYTIVCTFLIVIIQTVIFFPSLLFTIDFPFKFITWGSKLGHFSMNSPINWIPTELSYGNHGDMEVIAVILPIGQSLPRVRWPLKNSPPEIFPMLHLGVNRGLFKTGSICQINRGISQINNFMD